MGRQERRREERLQRMRDKQKNKNRHTDKLVVSEDDLERLQQDVSEETCYNNVDLLMTAFALALHKEFQFGQQRILRVWRSVDDIMGEVANDKKTADDLKNELVDEVGLAVKSEG